MSSTPSGYNSSASSKPLWADWGFDTCDAPRILSMVKIIGFLLILFGLWTVLFNHAFGSMIDPAVSDWEWWLQYLRSTWPLSLFSLALIFVGAWLLFGSPRRWGWKRWTPVEEPEHLLYIEIEKSQ
jgi:hypothetical protein